MPPQPAPRFEDMLTRDPRSVDELHMQILAQIRDTLTLQGKALQEQTATLHEMNVRIVRVETRDEWMGRIEKAVEKMKLDVVSLLRDRDLETGAKKGASEVTTGIRSWLPVIVSTTVAVASIFSAVYLAGRATDIIEPPPGIMRDHTKDGKAR